MAVAITRGDLSVDGLRREAARSRDASAARRMLAIALVLDGQSRENAAAACGMDRQSLRDWVHRYNAEGIAGLVNRHAPGPTPRLSAEQEATVERWIEDGPSLERDGVVRWRCRDVQERIAREFTVSLHERTVGKPGKSDSFAPARQAALPALVGASAPSRERSSRADCFQGGFAELVRAAVAHVVHGTLIEIWFMDKARVGQRGVSRSEIAWKR